MRRLTSLVCGRLGYGWVAAGALGLLLACSGEKFNPDSDCADGDCGAASNDGGTSQVGSGGKAGSGGKLASGGKFVGGASNVGGSSGGGPTTSGGSAGTDSGGTGSGGGSTAGGGGTPGVSGAGGAIQTPGFPTTEVLDDFNRAGPALGLSWIGGTDDYAIKEQTLWCGLCYSAALWSEVFGPEQEVFAKLVHFEAGAAEINLVLKAQSSPDCDLIEVLYAPVNSTVRIAYCTEGMWSDLEATPVTLELGDRLGGRARADGLIEIYVNERLITTVDASAFPFESGRLGVNGVSGNTGSQWDDFGGGDWR
jgi:hypothetical protein